MINRYELNQDVNIQKLEECGFRPGGWMPGIHVPKMMYMCPLIDEIELYIEINTNTFDFNDFYNIFIFDGNFGQAYYPFYDVYSDFEFLRNVRNRYNEEMDKLVDKGLFKKISEKTKKKTI